MKKKLIIHIGLHKTGSSFLQHCVFPKLKGVNYIYKPNNPLFVPILSSRINLISDEEISQSMPHKENDFKMILALHAAYPDAKIIIGVRNSSPWIRSCYAQYIKSGGSLTTDEYCVKYAHKTITPIYYYAYIKSLWKNVFMYWHEDLINNGTMIVRSICEFIGVPVPYVYTDRKVNVSLKHVEFWRRINKLSQGKFLRKHIESPYWICTFVIRRLKKEYRMEK